MSKAISVHNLSKSFRASNHSKSLKSIITSGGGLRTKHQLHKVLKKVDFSVDKGDFYAIVGKNGSGKSTLLKILAGVYSHDSGEVSVNGRLIPFIELGVGFNPELTGRDNVYLNASLLGFSRKETDNMYDSIVSFAELEEYMDERLKNYSSGMQVRLAFSIAIRAESDILLIDEVLAVGDFEFQQKCFDYFNKVKSEGKTVIFVSHDLNVVKQFCNKALYIEGGKSVIEGEPSKIIERYMKDTVDRMDSKATPDKDKKVTDTSSKAEITKFYTTSAGKTKTVFGPNEDITVGYQVKIKEDLKQIVFGLQIADDLGNIIFASNTSDKPIKRQSFKAGQVLQVEVKLENFFGNINLVASGAVANSDRTEVYSRIENAHAFRVSGVVKSINSMTNPSHRFTVKERI